MGNAVKAPASLVHGEDKWVASQLSTTASE
jgi:hypothetical protein